jgi:group I intron endonuclease
MSSLGIISEPGQCANTAPGSNQSLLNGSEAVAAEKTIDPLWFRNSGVYLIANRITGHVYVGSSAKVGERLRGHLKKLACGEHRNAYLQNAFNKYGAAAFRCEVLEQCAVDQLIEREQCWIDKHDAANHARGYNIRPTADRSTHAQSTRERLRVAATGFVVAEETKLKISRALSGRSKTTESIRKRMETVKRLGIPGSMTGKSHSEETKRKMREAATGRTHSESTRKKIGELKRGNTFRVGTTFSAATRQLMSERQAAFWTPEKRAAHSALLRQI